MLCSLSNSNRNILFLYGGNFPQTALASDTACDQERRLRNDHIMSLMTSIQPWLVPASHVVNFFMLHLNCLLDIYCLKGQHPLKRPDSHPLWRLDFWYRWVDGARHTPIIFVNLSPAQVGQIYHYGFDGLCSKQNLTSPIQDMAYF